MQRDEIDMCGQAVYVVQIGSWRSGSETGTWFISTISVVGIV